MVGSPEKMINQVRERVIVGLAYFLGFILLYSSSIHLANPYAFLSSIYSYDIVSERIGFIAAILLPSLQLTIGIALLFFTGLRKIAFFVAMILMLGFTVLQYQAWLRGLNIACGCFSSSHEDPINWFTISRTFLFFVIAVTGLILTKRENQEYSHLDTANQSTSTTKGLGHN